MEEGLSIFDLGFGFYVKNYPYGLIPKSKLANPGQNIRKSYAQTSILVNLIVVKIIGFLVITRNPVGISGPY